MEYTKHLASPLGEILLSSDGEGLTGLWFVGQKYFAAGLPARSEERELPVFERAEAWLETYFGGEIPPAAPRLSPRGTPFQREVWALLRSIPYGQTRSYGELAAELARRRGRERFSAQAVGGAVGHNPISLIIPCHRVLGADGRLTGYAGGLERKEWLLRLEGACRNE